MTTTHIKTTARLVMNPFLTYQSLRQDHRIQVDTWNQFIQTQIIPTVTHPQTTTTSETPQPQTPTPLSDADHLLLTLILISWEVFVQPERLRLHQRLQQQLRSVNRKRRPRKSPTLQQSVFLRSFSIWAHHREQGPNPTLQPSTNTSTSPARNSTDGPNRFSRN